jgi:L-threonylcarbamoyladenylate synthase
LPGKITLILPTAPHNRFPKEITSDNTLGVRVIELEALNCILRQFPHPITTTSVNPAGQPPARSVAQILSYFGDRIALILAHDKTTDSVPSTLVRVNENSLEIIRPGAVTATELEERMKLL